MRLREQGASLLVIATAACSFDLAPDASYACRGDEDCTLGYRCLRGVCSNMAAAGGGGGGLAMGGGVGGGLAMGGGVGGGLATEDGGPDAGPGDAGPGDAGPGDAGAGLGTVCSASGECGSGLCVDGRCCDLMCTGACDACNVTGHEGHCIALPRGTACGGGYACDGQAVSCPSACVTDAGCAPGFGCGVAGTCNALVRSLCTDFSAELTDAGWNLYTSGGAGARSGNGFATFFDGTFDSGYAGYVAPRNDLREGSITLDVPTPGPLSQVSFEAYLDVYTTAGNFISLRASENNLHAIVQLDGGSFSYVASIPFAAGAMRFWRIRETGGHTYWQYSADGGSFTTFFTEPTPMPLSDAYMGIGAGQWQNEDAGFLVQYSRLCGGPP